MFFNMRFGFVIKGNGVGIEIGVHFQGQIRQSFAKIIGTIGMAVISKRFLNDLTNADIRLAMAEQKHGLFKIQRVFGIYHGSNAE